MKVTLPSADPPLGNITTKPQHHDSLRAVLHGHECEQLQIKEITKSRFFIPTPLMKNVQRHIHYFIELTECDMWRATATEGREAAMPPAAL